MTYLVMVVTRELLGQQAAKTVNGAQRRTQIVRDGIGKSLKFLVGPAQGSLDQHELGHIGIDADPESHLALLVTHR